MKRWAVLTSGGDAPGMNAALHAFASAARQRRAVPIGVRRGFAGLLDGDLVELDADELAPWSRRGGTLLGTSRPAGLSPDRLARSLARHQLEGLVVLGGNGSTAAAAGLAELTPAGIAAVPATIDNDVAGSDESLGFDTAVNTALELLDRMRDTAEALPRLFALETLGGNDGRLAAAAGNAVSADAVLEPERPWQASTLEAVVNEAIARRGYALLVASEGYPGLEAALAELASRCALRLRFSRLGHAQRGGAPSYRDRSLGRRFGEAAAGVLEVGARQRLVVSRGEIVALPLTTAASAGATGE